MTWFQFLQIFAIGLFSVALLTGVATQYLNKPSTQEQKGWVGGMLKSIGLTSKEQKNRMQYHELIHQFQEQRESFNQHIKDQKQYVKDVQDESEFLSDLMRQMPDQDNDVSLLPLKDLIKKFKFQSQMVVDQQQKLENFNEKQKSIDYTHDISMDNIKAVMNEQSELLNEQASQYKELKVKLDQIQDKIKKLSNITTIPKTPEFSSKVENLSVETNFYLGNIRQRQDQVKKESQSASIDSNIDKYKRDDLNKRNQDNMAEHHQRLEDQTREINDRIRDQMERARDRNLR